jgi:threonine dehydrogenase-like Zn-dependent dehydrogenase
MKAVLFPGDRKVEVVERERPKPGSGEVLVRMRASAICRSDMGLYYGDPIVGGDDAATGTIVPGHEPAGEVAELGPDVTSRKVGDRVAAYLPVGCGDCHYCHLGELMLCPQWRCLGFDLDGGDAEYFVIPAINALPLAEELSFVAGSVMTDMIGTQYYTQKRLGVNGSTQAAIFGLGPMGVAGVMVAKGHGAHVIAVDPIEHRRDLAREVGADVVLDPSEDGDVVETIRRLTLGEGPDIAVDCSGAPAAQNAALDSVRKRGSVAFVGESRETTINPSDQIIRKTLQVIGGWYFPLWAWDEIQQFVLRRELPVERLVTHTFALDAAAEAFRMFDERATEKAVFVLD